MTFLKQTGIFHWLLKKFPLRKIILFLDETFFLRIQYCIGKMLDGAQNILFNVDKV